MAAYHNDTNSNEMFFALLMKDRYQWGTFTIKLHMELQVFVE